MKQELTTTQSKNTSVFYIFLEKKVNILKN